jgi:ribosomal protein S18 acetylase RimI-like enzyme
VRFVVSPTRAHLDGAVALLRETYWNREVSDADLGTAQRSSSAWLVGLAGGRVVATARAISDAAKLAYVMDVAVDVQFRGGGLGRRLMELLLDHPAVRGCHRVELHTRDAMPLYEKFGFERAKDPDWRVAMRLVRANVRPVTLARSATG